MPVRTDLEAATRAASDCLNASIRLLLAADDYGPAELREPGHIAEALGRLAGALPRAWRAISAVEAELTLAAPGSVSAAGMTCASAHRWALAYAELLAEAMLRVDARLLPIEGCSPEAGSGPFVEIVTANLPAIIRTLSAMPPFLPGEIVSQMQHEWARAIGRIEGVAASDAAHADDPAPEIPEDAVACSQNQLARALELGARGGLAAKLETQGVLSYAKWIEGQLYVIIRNRRDHEGLRRLVEEEKEGRHRGPKRPPGPTR
jgi:hypothetical protein